MCTRSYNAHGIDVFVAVPHSLYEAEVMLFYTVTACCGGRNQLSRDDIKPLLCGTHWTAVKPPICVTLCALTSVVLN